MSSGIQKTGFARFLDDVFGDETGKSVPSAVVKTLFPGIRSLVHDVGVAILDTVCYGGSNQQNNYNRQVGGYGGYGGIGVNTSVRQNYIPDRNASVDAPNKSASYSDWRWCYVTDAISAGQVISEMKAWSNEYGSCDLAYFYQLCGIKEYDAICKNYIWTADQIRAMDWVKKGGLFYFDITPPKLKRSFV